MEVLCWCCEYYWPDDDGEDGKCKLKNASVRHDDRVCPEFVLNSGLHTEREIPEYCLHYKRKK